MTGQLTHFNEQNRAKIVDSMIIGPTYLLSKTGGRAVTILARSWLNEQMEGRNFTDEYKVVSENEKTEVEFF
jgi:hypothetical protein